VLFPLALWKVRHGMVGRCRVYGGSMEPVIRSGSRVTFEPIDSDKVELGDIVVARIGESTMLHLVQAIDVQNRQVEISGTDGSSNGWAPLDCVLGICTEIEGSPVPGARAKVQARRGDRRRR
jgi:signal peptidase I